MGAISRLLAPVQDERWPVRPSHVKPNLTIDIRAESEFDALDLQSADHHPALQDLLRQRGSYLHSLTLRYEGLLAKAEQLSYVKHYTRLCRMADFVGSKLRGTLRDQRGCR